MTYDARKVLSGQSTATVARIKLDRCRHTTALSVTRGTIASSSVIAIGYTGNFTITGGMPIAFSNSTPYVLWDAEIIRVAVLSATQLDILERAALGTIAAAHSAKAIKLMHSGEADGSCYGFPHGCSSSDSYSATDKFIFDFPNTQLQTNRIFYNGYDSWSHNSAVVDPGQSIGKRASGNLTLKDSIDTDVYVPYPDRRSNKGTLFNKWQARHPNFSGRPIEILTGFNPLNFDEGNFINRQYVIDTYSLNNGIMNFSYKDPLILTEDKKAKAPLSSLGVLTAAVINSSTTITYGSAPALDYGASGTVFVRIDSEVIQCTVLSNFVLTIVTRAFGGTDIKDHSVNSTVQSCLVYNNQNVVEIIIDLLTNYTEISDEFFDDYTAIIAATLSITLTATISKPESVVTLINELIKNGDLNMYYSETEHLIKIKAVADESAGLININEDDQVSRNSIRVDENIKNQFTRYTVGWDVNDITKTKEDEYFSIIYQSINLTQELPKNKGEINELKTFYNRWLTGSNDDVIIGTSIAQRLIDRSNLTPEIFTIDLDVSSVFNTQGSRLDLGTIFNLSTSRRVNADGSNKAANYQVLSMKDLDNDKYQLKARLFQDPINNADIGFTISANQVNYDLSVDFAPVAGNYVILIDTAVEIGSTSTSTPAFTTGTQANGVTFDFIIRGSILGMGGAGGDGGEVQAPSPQDEDGTFKQTGTVGFIGGNSFNATVPCTINVGAGAIWAGGGGAAGEESEVTTVAPNTINANADNGGSGGQGFATSLGGDAGQVSVDGHGIVDTGLIGATGGKGTPGSQGSNDGGTWGESGDSESGISGGLGGYAIVSNGNAITITNGNNQINIKGRQI